MPLSHVCVWDADIGYKRISLESACKMYPNGASAKSGYFVCELCAQNVLLTAPGVNVRHFRHDPSSPNKECDERQAHFDPLYGRRLRSLNSHLMPLRITVAKESFALQMGFFCPPDSGARCDKIRITTNSGKAYEYSFERIERGGTTYLNIGETPSREYNLEYINAAADLVKFWPSKVPGISSSGSFFDERTGRILPSGAKAYFGDSYYLLQSKPLGYPPTGLEVSEVLRTKTGSLATWYLYKIQIKRFSEITAKFFLKYAIFLTEHPTKFYAQHNLWACKVMEPPKRWGKFAPRRWATEVGYEQTSDKSADISYSVRYDDIASNGEKRAPRPQFNLPKLAEMLISSEKWICSANGEVLHATNYQQHVGSIFGIDECRAAKEQALNAGEDKMDKHWISLCKVNRLDKNRDNWMLRLADAVGGVLVAPDFDKQKEQIHDNRLFIFCDDGPTEPGRIGFWEWEEFESEPGRWKTTSTYMEQTSPVEVIILDEVSNIEGVIMSLKSGLKIPSYAHGKIIFAAKNGTVFEGVLCDISKFLPRQSNSE